VIREHDAVAAAEAAYAERYQAPRERDDRVAVEISVDRIIGRG
jgi:F420H(2)-dependent biliverdin reductase